MKRNRRNEYHRQKKIERIRVKWKVRKKAKNRLKHKPSMRFAPREKKKILGNNKRKFYLLPLPATFSFIENATDTLQFFQDLKKFIRNKISVVIDFTNVEKITPDVICLLMAKVSNPRYIEKAKLYVNKPKHKELDQLLLDSGFYKHLGLPNSEPQQGALHTRKNTNVEPVVAQSVRKLASLKTYNCDKLLQPLYRTLIECMANTKKHAAGKISHLQETWWLAVYNNPLTHVTSFSFCDTGVGIFKSRNWESLVNVAIKVGLTSRKEILLKILEGKLTSGTGLKNRGKGLPKIFSDYKNKSLNRLIIITNDLFADFDSGIFVDLKIPLNGTFLYWEILPNLNDNI